MEFESRIVAPEYSPESDELENSLRPKTLKDYVGQEKAKEKGGGSIQKGQCSPGSPSESH